MLKANQIRIGNLIASGTNKQDPETWTIGRVLAINQTICEFEQIYVETEESYDWFFKDNYFSIPLTQEYLKKLGFQINRITKEENNIWRKNFEEGFFELEEINSFFFGHPLHSVQIKTVDHLQNLYYFITGEELDTSSFL